MDRQKFRNMLDGRQGDEVMNDMYIGQSPLERGYDEPDEDPLVTENNRLTDRIAELTAEVTKYRASLEELGRVSYFTNLKDFARNALKEGV